MNRFVLNGIPWQVIFVNPYDNRLVDRSGHYTLGTTDPSNHKVYISNVLSGGLLTRVMIHEISHCVMISYGLLDDIHRSVYQSQWVVAEEWICNLFADYGMIIFNTAYGVLGGRAIHAVPRYLEEMMRGYTWKL